MWRPDVKIHAEVMTQLTATSSAPVVPERVRRWPAILTLALAAPLTAELALGTIGITTSWTLALFGFIYSGGALLLRDLSRRRGLGVWALIGLGVAYGLVEEGLALGSLTSTTLYPVSDWAPRLLGFNTAYTVMVLAYHAVFSIVVPIALVDLLFPRLSQRRYLRTGGLIAWSVVFVLGVGLVKLSTLISDPTHHDAPARLIAELVVIVAVVAWAVTRRPARPCDRPVPSPKRMVVYGATYTLVFFGLLFPLPGAQHSAYLPAGWSWIAPVVAILLAAALVLATRGWTTSSCWRPAHSAGLIAGALPAHTLIGLLGMDHGTVDQIGLVAILVAEIVFGCWLFRRSSRTDLTSENGYATESSPATQIEVVEERTITPSRRSSVGRRPLTVVLALVAALAVRLGAQTLGHQPQVITMAGAPATTVSVGSVALVACAAGILAWVLRVVLDRWLRRSRRTWTIVAVSVLLLSLLGTLAGATPGDSLVLVTLHLIVGCVLILGIGGSSSPASVVQETE